jgi:hypothetical protein
LMQNAKTYDLSKQYIKIEYCQYYSAKNLVNINKVYNVSVVEEVI